MNDLPIHKHHLKHGAAKTDPKPPAGAGSTFGSPERPAPSTALPTASFQQAHTGRPPGFFGESQQVKHKVSALQNGPTSDPVP